MGSKGTDSNAWSQDDLDPEKDTDFMSIKCWVCDKAWMGQTMSRCGECERLICQPCAWKNVYVGCEKDNDEKICHVCFTMDHDGKREYCPKQNCDCDNQAPASAIRDEAHIHNESSASKDEDTDFVMRKCGVCQERTIGKSMYPCPACRLPMCQSCDGNGGHMGCTHDEPDPICSKCFQDKHKGKRKYCPNKDCDCKNPSPKKAKKLEAALEVADSIDAASRASIDVAAWKKTHPPINYPGNHKGKYLIDLFLSDNDFEHGYAQWLVDRATNRPAGQSYADYDNFQRYRAEAKEIIDLYKKIKPVQSRYSLRKRDKSPKRAKK